MTSFIDNICAKVKEYLGQSGRVVAGLSQAVVPRQKVRKWDNLGGSLIWCTEHCVTLCAIPVSYLLLLHCNGPAMCTNVVIISGALLLVSLQQKLQRDASVHDHIYSNQQLNSSKVPVNPFSMFAMHIAHTRLSYTSHNSSRCLH